MKSSIKKILQISLIVLVFVFITSLIINLILKKPPLQGDVAGGALTLPDSFSEEEILFLDGEWEFYKGVLLQPGDALGSPDTYLKVPGSWNSQDRFPVSGVGTYRLLINGVKPQKIYGFYIMNPSTAYNLIVNGKEILNCGFASDRLDEYCPKTLQEAAIFSADSEQLEVLVQMANYTRNNAGLTRTVAFGSAEKIYDYHQQLLIGDVLFFGGILVMALYHLVLYRLKNDRAALHFTIFCCLVAIDSAFSGTQLAFRAFPNLGVPMGIRIVYLSNTITMPLFIYYIKNLFPEETPEVLKKISIAGAVLQMGLILILPVTQFLEYYSLYYIFIVILGIYLLTIILKAAKHKRLGAGIILIGGGVIFATALNDILYARLIIQTAYLLDFGFFIFLILQAGFIAVRYSWAMHEVESLTHHLENRVNERTEELMEEKNRLEEISRMDDMTHIYNKRYIMDRLFQEMESFKKGRQIFSIAMIDIDFFKEINDQYGHLIGDRVIAQIALAILKSIRKTDLCGRFGGEEFIIIMRGTQLSGAYTVAEKIRQMISDLQIETEKGTVTLRASFGLAEADETMEDADRLIYYADKALYRAKDNGRNRVECYKTVRQEMVL